MFIKSIDSIVRNNILDASTNMNKNEALKYFAINKDGFSKIYSEIKQSPWFKYKIPETITVLIKLSIAKYINKQY